MPDQTETYLDGYTPSEIMFMNHLRVEGPVLRKMLCKDEIKTANKLSKDGVICKGTSDDKQQSVQFSLWG